MLLTYNEQVRNEIQALVDKVELEIRINKLFEAEKVDYRFDSTGKLVRVYTG